MFVLLLACAEPAPPPAAPPTGPDTPAEAARQAARAAPVSRSGWEGPWRRQVLAADVEDPGAVALAAGLDTPLLPWDGRRPAAGRDVVTVLWARPDVPVATLKERLAPRSQPDELVVVLAPGDAAWSAAAQVELPWVGAGIVDPVASAGLWTDPAGLPARQLGRVAARVVADRYGLHYAAGGGPYPEGLQAFVDVVPSTVLRGDSVPARAGAARVLPSDALVSDDEVAVRLAVATATSSQEALARLATDPEPLVRARAAEKLEDVALLGRLAEDPSSVVRVVAAHRLAGLAPTGRLGAEAPLRGLTRSPDAYVRWKAAWGLGAAPEGTDALVALLGDVDADVRREAARALGRRGDPAGVDGLVAAASDPNSFVRRWVVEALGHFAADPRARAALERATSDPTGLVAGEARRALQRPGPVWTPPPPPADDAAIDRLQASPDATDRKDLCKFLAGRPGSEARLVALAADGDSEVRKAAVEALGWFPDPGPHLEPALRDPDPDVVVTALEALGRDGKGHADTLLPLTLAADAEVRLRAWEALAALGPSDALAAGATDPDERVRAAVVAVSPDRLAAAEPAVIVRRAAAAAGAAAGPDALVAAAAPGAPAALAAWGRGMLALEDDLVHLRFSWNAPADMPAPYRALRPPVVRVYGHPNRG